jgi:protease I
MKLQGKKVGIFIESDYFEKEIFYYQFRFLEEGCDVHFFSRLWGQESITFTGHEYKVPFECNRSFENMSDTELASYDVIIVPSGIVSDRLRYTEDVHTIPPACTLLKRAFANRDILKGIICHGMWLISPIAEVIKGRNVVVHNNLYGDAVHYGLNYVDEDVVVDQDLVTARTGMHCHLFANKIIELLLSKQ